MNTDTRAQVQITYKKRRGKQKKRKVFFFQAQALVSPRVFIVSCTSGSAFPCVYECVSKKISDKNQKTTWKAWRSS